jgi:hypothetical protein
MKQTSKDAIFAERMFTAACCNASTDRPSWRTLPVCLIGPRGASYCVEKNKNRKIEFSLQFFWN